MIPFVDLKAQYNGLRDEIRGAIDRTLESAQFILGDEVAAFEEEFARYCGAAFAVGVNSGTSALHLALLAAGVGVGDEVITVPHTFVATAAAIRYTGARPVFVDIDPRSFTLDPKQFEAAITPRAKAVIPVHLYGQPADMNPILDIARRHGLIVIEDAAQAHGAEYRGRRAGGLGDIACFSFYPGKNLGAYGEGGAVVTNDPDYVNVIKMLRDHGQSKKHEHALVGYNYRMEGIQGAILRVKLRHLDEWTAARRAHAVEYSRRLAGVPVGVPEEMPYAKHVWHIFAIRTQNRGAMMAHLKAEGVGTGIHYPTPVHLQPAYRDLGFGEGDFPYAERAAREALSLPMYAELTGEQIARVAEVIRET
ncbi:MAG: DegT/DnrJ/EryC1/StrS family aminotransferase [Chloroflexi bacterium]|nr:DegT/DnrJ/EryC1/StrS family aminotransferase [Chloroflexota bacterium]